MWCLEGNLKLKVLKSPWFKSNFMLSTRTSFAQSLLQMYLHILGTKMDSLYSTLRKVSALKLKPTSTRSSKQAKAWARVEVFSSLAMTATSLSRLWPWVTSRLSRSCSSPTSATSTSIQSQFLPESMASIQWRWTSKIQFTSFWWGTARSARTSL